MKASVNHPWRMVGTLAGLLVLLSVTVLYGVMEQWTACVVFLTVACLYFWLCRDAFDKILVDDAGVTLVRLGKTIFVPWAEIREIGVLLPNAMKRLRRDKQGSRCSLYYAPKRLNNEERLAACISVPGDMIVVSYQPRRLQTTLAHWAKPVIFFNVTCRELFGDGTVAAASDWNIQEIRY